jgi:hypothetical protein
MHSLPSSSRGPCKGFVKMPDFEVRMAHIPESCSHVRQTQLVMMFLPEQVHPLEPIDPQTRMGRLYDQWVSPH